MKKVIVIFAAIVMIAGFSSKLFAQGGAGVTEGTSAGAKLISPISITETSVNGLHFGTMSTTTAGGSCVLATNGDRSATGGVNLSSVSPTKSNAAYTVNGTSGYTYAILLPATIIVTETATSTTMTINALKARPASAPADGLIGTLGASGDTFTVGGTLIVGTNQVAAVYGGTFDVNVAYN